MDKLDKINWMAIISTMKYIQQKEQITHILNDMENFESLCWNKETRNKLIPTYNTIGIQFSKDKSYP